MDLRIKHFSAVLLASLLMVLVVPDCPAETVSTGFDDDSIGSFVYGMIVTADVKKVLDNRTLGDIVNARMPWFIGSTGLLLFVFVLVVILFIRNRRKGKQLEQQTVMLSTVLRSLPDLVYSKDINGAYTSCNHRFEELAGCPETEIIGKNPLELFVNNEKMARGIFEVDQKVLDEKNEKMPRVVRIFFYDVQFLHYDFKEV